MTLFIATKNIKTSTHVARSLQNRLVSLCCLKCLSTRIYCLFLKLLVHEGYSGWFIIAEYGVLISDINDKSLGLKKWK